MTKTEKRAILLKARTETFKGMTQAEMARALQVSLPTVVRWEAGTVEVPDHTAKMLECLLAFVTEERRRKQLKVDEIRQAMDQTGIVGVLSSAAVAQRLPKAVLAGLTMIPLFGWIGMSLAAVAGVAGSSYFRKLVEGQKESEIEK